MSGRKRPIRDRRGGLRVPDLLDERDRRAVVQVVIGVVVALVLARFFIGVAEDFESRGLSPGFGFLQNAAGFGISEARAFTETDSYWQAFRVGLENTLRVAVLGIILATPLGALIALARLSGNPIATRVSAAYIEVFRNTPLLVQLIFWYQGVMLRLPALSEARTWGAVTADADGGVARSWIALSQKGVALATLIPGDGSGAFGAAVVGGAIAAALVLTWRRRRSARTGERAFGLTFAGLTWLMIATLAWIAFGHGAFTLELPSIERFRYAGGIVLSPEYSALLVGLVAYTAAFIAEVVRGGVQSVSSGQYEAGRAVGLDEGQLLRYVVFPQALRVIVPPLTNQYLNLTKNSSLAIYIGYPDLFNVSLTIGNQTGQFVIVTAMIMAVYLVLSLVSSLAMNAYGRRIRLVER